MKTNWKGKILAMYSQLRNYFQASWPPHPLAETRIPMAYITVCLNHVGQFLFWDWDWDWTEVSWLNTFFGVCASVCRKDTRTHPVTINCRCPKNITNHLGALAKNLRKDETNGHSTAPSLRYLYEYRDKNL